MAIKLYGAPGSTATLRVRACLAEKDLDYEFVNVDMANKEHKKPEFLSRNPFGQVPVLEDGDLTLFESRAITQYLAHAYPDKGNSLIINDPKKMAILAVWIEVESQKFEPTASKLLWELILKSMLFGMSPDEVVVDEYEKKLEDVLNVYEKRLSECKYLGGDSFTLVDLHHLPNLKYLMGTKVKRLFDARPHVSAWAADLESRSGSIKAYTVERDVLMLGRDYQRLRAVFEQLQTRVERDSRRMDYLENELMRYKDRQDRQEALAAASREELASNVCGGNRPPV